MTTTATEDPLVRNEQAKLTATYLNGLAIAFAAVGGIAPWVGSAQAGQISAVVASLTLGCGFLSAGLHVVARRVLRSLVA